MKISELISENKTLRRLLWIRHGCPIHALYGDDGELQCHACMLDFKRDSAQRIDETFTAIGMRKYLEGTAKKDKKKRVA